MSVSLRDQLLQLGFKSKPPEPPQPERAKHSSRPEEKRSSEKGRPKAPHHADVPKTNISADRDAHRPPQRSQTEIDLAKAYALRGLREQEERIAAEQAKQEAARLRREARARLIALIAGKSLNDPNAEIARHFPYGGKIKRVYVNAEQLRALNAGQLGVVQIDGRYHLVGIDTLTEVELISASAIAFKVDPNAPVQNDTHDIDSDDPKFQVPDDLVW